MNKYSRKKNSISTRILVSILILLGAIFLGIVISFNVAVDTFIQKSTEEQLRKATETVNRFDNGPILDKPNYGFDKTNPNLPNIELHTSMYSKFIRQIQDSMKFSKSKYILEAMVINDNYELVFPTRKEDFLKDIDKYESILNEIRKDEYDLNSNENIKVSTDNSSHYVSVVKINSLNTDSNLYTVIFIDISNILHIARIIDVVLIVIMCIAGILAIFTAILLSKQISKPIEKLCEFAQNIGDGKFEKCEFNFVDKELDELSQIMNKSAEQLDEYDKEQKIFFQNASHELRTPLMSIKGYAEAIKYNVIDTDTASDVILEESDRLTDMVEDLLYISKMDNITKDYMLVECDLRETLSNCVLKQKARAIAKGIEFEYDFDENPVLLNCDEKSISRAFLNLIENALRYAKTEIIIGCKFYKDKIIIYVKDDGEGIKENDMPFIFNRFYKGEKGKHGIGLSIVKSIINKHNGKIFAENSSKGAKFTIVINL